MPTPRRRKLRQELLEPRHLLALDVTFSGGVLEIVSDDHDDMIVTAVDGHVKINGLDPARGCLVAGAVQEIHANGGVLSRVDLSGVWENRKAFPKLKVATGTAPSAKWLREVAEIEMSKLDQLHASLYADRQAQTHGVPWSAKADAIDQILRRDGITRKQLQWVRDVDFFAAHKMAYYDALRIEDTLDYIDPAPADGSLSYDVDLAEGEEPGQGDGQWNVNIIVPPGGQDLDPPYDLTFVDEEAGVARVWMSAPSPNIGINGFTVDYVTSEDTALDGPDYQGISGTLAWGDKEEGVDKHVDIPIVDDMVDEEIEYFDFTISYVQNMDGEEGDVSLGNDLLRHGIIDNDPPPVASIHTDTSVSEGGGAVTLEIRLSSPSEKTVAIGWSTAPNPGPDGATAGLDFVSTSGVETFAPGETIKQVSVSILEDTIYECDELFQVDIISVSNATLGSPYTAVVTIVENDPLPNVTIEDVTVNEWNGPAHVRVTMDRVSSKPVSIPYWLTQGTAVTPWDYGNQTGTISLPPGSTFDYIDVTIVNDNLAEYDENFFIHLGPATHAVTADPLGIVTIISDDPDPWVYIDNVTVAEGDPGDTVNAVFTVSLSGPSGRPMSVAATTTDGTAKAVDDYTASSEGFHWPMQPNGQYTTSDSKQFIVPIVNDLIPEETEEFYALLSTFTNVQPGIVVGVGTITDDDMPKVESLEFEELVGSVYIGGTEIHEGDQIRLVGTVVHTRTNQALPFEPVTVRVDLNYSDSFESTEIYETISDSAGNFIVVISSPLSDDGFIPGNQTASDPLIAEALPTRFVGMNPETGKHSANVDVHNVAPVFDGPLALDVSYDLVSKEPISFQLEGAFYDAGATDFHTIVIWYGDSASSTTELNGERSFSITVPVTSSRDLESIQVKVEDDDLGDDNAKLAVAKVVVKSFINGVPDPGEFPSSQAYSASEIAYVFNANQNLELFADATDSVFQENPEFDIKDSKYRLYTRVDIAVSAHGDESIATILLTDEDGGSETPPNLDPLSPFFGTWIEDLVIDYAPFQGTINLDMMELSNSENFVNWRGWGRPDPNLEPAFDYIWLRDSVNIWHLPSVAWVVGTDEIFFVPTLERSAFPSHRLWINGDERITAVQHEFSNLWRSNPDFGPSFVNSAEIDGLYSVQIVDGTIWNPNP
jgi:hypothetical protein